MIMWRYLTLFWNNDCDIHILLYYIILLYLLLLKLTYMTEVKNKLIFSVSLKMTTFWIILTQRHVMVQFVEMLISHQGPDVTYSSVPTTKTLIKRRITLTECMISALITAKTRSAHSSCCLCNPLIRTQIIRMVSKNMIAQT